MHMNLFFSFILKVWDQSILFSFLETHLTTLTAVWCAMLNLIKFTGLSVHYYHCTFLWLRICLNPKPPNSKLQHWTHTVSAMHKKDTLNRNMQLLFKATEHIKTEWILPVQTIVSRRFIEMPKAGSGELGQSPKAALVTRHHGHLGTG